MQVLRVRCLYAIESTPSARARALAAAATFAPGQLQPGSASQHPKRRGSATPDACLSDCASAPLSLRAPPLHSACLRACPAPTEASEAVPQRRRRGSSPLLSSRSHPSAARRRTNGTWTTWCAHLMRCRSDRSPGADRGAFRLVMRPPVGRKTLSGLCRCCCLALVGRLPALAVLCSLVQIPTSLSPYFAPVNPKSFTTLWITLMVLGQTAGSRNRRNRRRQTARHSPPPRADRTEGPEPAVQFTGARWRVSLFREGDWMQVRCPWHLLSVAVVRFGRCVCVSVQASARSAGSLCQ
jgi:hypothetical protein